MSQSFRISEQECIVLGAGFHAGACQTLLPEFQRLAGTNPPDDPVHHPGPRPAGLSARIFKEREIGARTRLLLAIEDVVDAGVVLVHAFGHQAQTQGSGIELQVAPGIARDGADVVDACQAHFQPISCGPHS